MPNIGLVISGGMAKGAYQVGALEAISEYLRPEDIKYISAASVGAINGYAFSCDQLHKARDMWLSLNNEKKKLFLTSVYKSNFLKEAVLDLNTYDPVCRHFYAPLLHLKKGNLEYWDLCKEEDRVRRARLMRASMAFPPFTGPIEIDKKNYYDGALVDNIPVKPLMKHSVDYVICMYFDQYNYSFESEYFDNKVIKLTFDDNSTFLAESFWFTRDGLEDMMKRGYKRAKTVMEFIFPNGTDDIEKVYERVEAMNALHPNKQPRLTGDVVVNNFNKLAKRFAKRTIIK